MMFQEHIISFQNTLYIVRSKFVENLALDPNVLLNKIIFDHYIVLTQLKIIFVQCTVTTHLLSVPDMSSTTEALEIKGTSDSVFPKRQTVLQQHSVYG